MHDSEHGIPTLKRSMGPCCKYINSCTFTVVLFSYTCKEIYYGIRIWISVVSVVSVWRRMAQCWTYSKMQQ